MLGNWNKRREARQGISLHYDGSAGDKGAVAWLTKDERCKLSYTRIVLDDGTIVQVAPDDARQWSEGACRPSSVLFTYKDANSALYGLAIAAKGTDKITQPQFDSLVRVCVEWFKKNGWSRSETWRITTHQDEAWPRGRKIDIAGPNKNDPVCDVNLVRKAVSESL